MEKRLLTLKEFCAYTGLGMTKAREILKDDKSNFTVRIGNRLYVDKPTFDTVLRDCMENHQTI